MFLKLEGSMCVCEREREGEKEREFSFTLKRMKDRDMDIRLYGLADSSWSLGRGSFLLNITTCKGKVRSVDYNK